MSAAYKFLPFRFRRNGKNVLIVNEVGDYHILPGKTFQRFIEKKLKTDCEDFYDLQSKGMVFTDSPAQIIDWLATRYRTKKKYLYDFTSLHMFVVTLRCNQ